MGQWSVSWAREIRAPAQLLPLILPEAISTAILINLRNNWFTMNFILHEFSTKALNSNNNLPEKLGRVDEWKRNWLDLSFLRLFPNWMVSSNQSQSGEPGDYSVSHLPTDLPRMTASLAWDRLFNIVCWTKGERNLPHHIKVQSQFQQRKKGTAGRCCRRVHYQHPLFPSRVVLIRNRENIRADNRLFYRPCAQRCVVDRRVWLIYT